jgi:predicted TIM-barrel fold metal-dependent hydrolase
MSGYASLRGAEVREKLDHPVIDADAHIVECHFALMECIEEVAGKNVAARAEKAFQNTGAHGAAVKGFWWGLSSGEHTGDRALAMLPRYLRSRLDALGIDFAHCYTTMGLAHLYLVDDELRQATCRALNTMYAEMFKGCGDRLRPVAVIPTYTPKEALAELEYAVNELGFKAIHIGTELRGPGQPAPGADPLKFQSQSTRSIIMDSPYDYDPFWKRCLELKVAPACHTSSRGVGYRASPSNYVFNHLGDFAEGANFFCRSLIFSGVTRRFPKLSFAFLEGGVSWALTLLSDIIEHWEKRNAEALEQNLNPDLLDVDLLERLFREFGTERLRPERIRKDPHGRFQIARPALFDEFAACALKEIRDLKALFVDPFYFGCEAEDRMVAAAFDRKLSPVGLPLKAMLGSDIGHWDVLDAETVLGEAWRLVQAKLLTRENLRDFIYVNPAMFHLSVNPDYFQGTVVEDETRKLLAAKTPRPPQAGEGGARAEGVEG